VIDDLNPRLTNALVILNPRQRVKDLSSTSAATPQCGVRSDLQYNPDSEARPDPWNKMLRTSRYFLVILTLAASAAQPNYAQDKTKDPKIVIDLEKPSPPDESNTKNPANPNDPPRPSTAQPFGKACSAAGAAKDGYRTLDQPYTISDLFGAPIAVIIVRRLGAGQEKPDREELRKRIFAVLSAQTTEVSRYQDWDEWVPQGLVVTIQYYDRTKSVLEESAGHVCFSDYAGTVWWLRIPVIAPKPQP